jgi:hypothetical protein
MEFYVYIYFYKNIPIYVGKGKNNRCRVHLKRCLNYPLGKSPFYDKLKKILTNGETPQIKIEFSGLTEENALIEERNLQVKYGSKLDGTGTLYNYVECGRKNPILIGDKNPMKDKSIFDVWVEKYGDEITKQKKDEYSKKMSKIVSGRTHNDSTKEIMRNKKKSYWDNLTESEINSFRKKISESHTNERKNKFVETTIKLNKSRTGEKHHNSVKCLIDGVVYNSISEVCKKYGFKNHNAVTNRLKSINFPTWNYYN